MKCKTGAYFVTLNIYCLRNPNQAGQNTNQNYIKNSEGTYSYKYL